MDGWAGFGVLYGCGHRGMVVWNWNEIVDWRKEYVKEMRVSSGSGCEARTKARPAGLVV